MVYFWYNKEYICIHPQSEWDFFKKTQTLKSLANK